MTVVLGLDGIRNAVVLPFVLDAVTDEVAHLATAVLVLSAAGGWLCWTMESCGIRCAVFAAVLIDLDHVPLYAGRRTWPRADARSATR